MGYDINNYDDLLGHLDHHGVKEWLLTGAKQEDANTIRRAVERISSHRLARGLAKILARG